VEARKEKKAAKACEDGEAEGMKMHM
jgi:hypothetical protein